MISIIVPNYNHLKFLPQRMESILSQTFQDYEIILLDDCSSDGSREWLESMHSCPRVKHIVLNETNSGSPFKQWRKGIELAEGEFIWIAESDDFCEPELLETLYAPFRNNPGMVLSFCRSMLVDTDGSELGLHMAQARLNEPMILSGDVFTRNYLSSDNVVVNASGALFRKKAALETAPEYMTYKMVGDWLFWANLCMQGSVAYSPVPLNKFRQHGNGTTISTTGSFQTELEHLRLFKRMSDLNMISKATAYKKHFLCYYQIVYRSKEELSAEQKAMLDDCIPLSIKILSRIKYLKRRIFNRKSDGIKLMSILSDPSLRSQFAFRLKHISYSSKKSPSLLLCCIGKEENRYAREFVQWYRDLGFSKVVIYDNNSVDGERFESVLSDYIACGFVKIMDFRGRKVSQLAAYEDCYRRFGEEYDWLAFFDMDEFLEIEDCPSAPEYFSSAAFRHYDMVHINWLCYGDNENLHYEDRPLRERFPNPITPANDINKHIKSVVRGGIGGLKWTDSPHTPCPNVLRCANASGNKCNSESPFSKCDISVARLRHHMIKSTEEYRDKILRGYPDHIVSSAERARMAHNYFAYCRRTPEKEKILTLD